MGLISRRKERDMTFAEDLHREANTPLTPEEQRTVDANRKTLLDVFNRTSTEAWERVNARLGDPQDHARVPGHLWFLLFADPVERDSHLGLLDIDGLPLLRDRRLSLAELTEIARRREDLMLLARTDLAPVPVLWRWLRDASRRRLIEPAEPTTPAAATSTWDLTDAGLAAIRRDESFIEWLTRTVRTHWAGSVALLGAVVGLFGAAAVRHSLAAVVPYLLAAVGGLVASVIVSELIDRVLARRREPEGRYSKFKRAGLPTPVEYAVWSEVSLQLTAAHNPDFPRLWLDVDSAEESGELPL
jgi:hypothetical protein